MVSNKLKTWLIILVSIIGCCIISYQGLVRGCFWWDCVPERDFEVYVLSLQRSYKLFPTETDFSPLSPNRSGNIYATDEYSQGLSWKIGQAYFMVKRFVSTHKASNIFEEEKDLNFFSSPLDVTSEYETIFSYNSTNADEYFIDCGIHLEDVECVFGARYEEFYLFYQSTIDQYMTVDGYLAIIQHIDQKMRELLNLY